MPSGLHAADTAFQCQMHFGIRLAVTTYGNGERTNLHRIHPIWVVFHLVLKIEALLYAVYRLVTNGSLEFTWAEITVGSIIYSTRQHDRANVIRS